MTIGRDKGNEIALADVALSRRHAEVFPGPDGFYIRDLGSSNGVRVNQTRIGNPYLLAHGDRIEVGSSMLYFIDMQSRLRETERVAAQLPQRGTRELVGAVPGATGQAPSRGAALQGASAGASYTPTVLAGTASAGKAPTGKTQALPDPRLVICRTCGVANAPVARFCAGCSAPLGPS